MQPASQILKGSEWAYVYIYIDDVLLRSYLTIHELICVGPVLVFTSFPLSVQIFPVVQRRPAWTTWPCLSEIIGCIKPPHPPTRPPAPQDKTALSSTAPSRSPGDAILNTLHFYQRAFLEFISSHCARRTLSEFFRMQA